MEQTLQTALDHLARDLGLEDLALSRDGTAALAVDDVEIGITLLGDIGQVHLLAIVGAMPETEGPELAKVLLAANHMGAMTMGASLGLDAEADLITVNLCLPAEAVTGPMLRDAIERVANVTSGWRTNLPVLRDADAGAGPAPEPAGASGGDWLRL